MSVALTIAVLDVAYGAMNRTMLRLARPWVLVLLVALTCASQPKASESLSQAPVMKLTADSLVTGTFRGQTLTLLLDTGTTMSFIDVRVAKAAGGVLRDLIPLSGIGPRRIQAGLLTRPLAIQFPFDGGAIEHTIEGVEDYGRLSALVGRDIHGILGADFIDRFVVEIDYLAELIRLHPKKFKVPADATTVPLRLTIGRTPVVDVRVHLPDGKAVKARAMIDTGAAGALTATERFSKQHRLRDVLGGIDVPLGEGAAGKFSGRLARLPVLDLATFRMSLSTLSLPGPNSGVLSRTSEFDLNVGSSVLKRFTVFFDYGRQKMSLVPNARLGDAFTGLMSGLEIATLGSPHDRVVVEGVIPNSPAAEAGFEPGDEIVEVNGERLAPLALVDLRSRLRQPEGTELKITTRRKDLLGVMTLVLRRLVDP